MAEDTPLFDQYRRIKNQHKDEVLFFRLGDFYEMFEDDALEVSRLLNLTLTHRQDKPMCGIPYHASKIYIARLLRLGKKIAIAEQVGEIAHGKGITERKVIETITPGTALESEYLEGSLHNYLASVFVSRTGVGLAYLDVTTGTFRATSFSVNNMELDLPKELGRCSPRELLLPQSLQENPAVRHSLEILQNCTVSWYGDWNFNAELSYARLTKQFNTQNLRSFSLMPDSPEVPPAGFLLDYLAKTTNTPSPHVSSIEVYKDTKYVIVDDSSRRNLEITENLRDGGKQYSLLECLDFTRTAMGGRMLREWLLFPLTDMAAIVSRQEHVSMLVRNRPLLRSVRDHLGGILDVERLAGRIALDKAHAKDLQALRLSLELWLKAQGVLGPVNFAGLPDGPAREIIDLVKSSLLDDPSTSLTEGGIIRPGWSEELDKWRDIQQNFNKVLADYLEEEKSLTGIQNLRIKSTGNLGYFLEVTKGKLPGVPSHFIMRRSLVNAERYTTERLQDLEARLTEAGGRILELERDLFLGVRAELKKYTTYLRQASSEIAYADVCASLAEAAVRQDWTCPELVEGQRFLVEEGRHPVVELHLPTGEFVPNSISLCEENDTPSFALITGPNMAGKSTFLRQNALIALLAQTGSFVPAKKAVLGLVDRIFCRVGASDNLARGESTFLVEMTETAHILRSATCRSLVIMDEVGRGTSTEDGLAIAWAVSEYLLNRIRCKTLFATHYHELTRLEHESMIRLCMAVSESGKDIVFLRQVIHGASANSYGIHVASLAGVPRPVIDRASDILGRIQSDAAARPILPEQGSYFPERGDVPQSPAPQEPSDREGLTGALFSDEEMILDEILSQDPDNLTPMEALKAISRWKKILSGR
ncbi:MAG: DNA mismatch repair protein MutS [Treponema sp.]|nr:DNA mismatch repair protein MutS [Treponema sp.]